MSKKLSFFYLSQDWYEHLDDMKVRDYLTSFNLSDQEMYKSISYNYLHKAIIDKKFKELSPGVRVKLLLGVISGKKYDLIIWDEPTNHLDVMSQSILHEAFCGYSGTAIVITHDKQYIDDERFTLIEL